VDLHHTPAKLARPEAAILLRDGRAKRKPLI